MNSPSMRCFKIALGQAAEPRRDPIDRADAARDVVDEIDDFHNAVIEIENRIVRRLDPELLAAIDDALGLLNDVFAAIQSPPEFLDSPRTERRPAPRTRDDACPGLSRADSPPSSRNFRSPR